MCRIVNIAGLCRIVQSSAYCKVIQSCTYFRIVPLEELCRVVRFAELCMHDCVPLLPLKRTGVSFESPLDCEEGLSKEVVADMDTKGETLQVCGC